MELIRKAQQYVELGFSPLPIRGDKRPCGKWERYQTQRLALDEVEKAFSHSTCEGIGIACGSASNGLEVIDFDLHNDVTGSLWDAFVAAMNEIDAELFASLFIQESRSGGRHIWYRCEVVEGNQKLAMRPATEEEFAKHLADESVPRKKAHRGELPKTTIETRGQGGYICAYPTPGYKFAQGKPSSTPTITPEQRALILEVCRHFNEVVEAPKTVAESKPEPRQYEAGQPAGGKRPGDHFDECTSVRDMMISEGWTPTGIRVIDTSGDSGERFRKPGSQRHDGSAVVYDKNAVLFFSTEANAPIGKALRPWHFYAYLEHGGDFTAAAKDLAAKGFGEKTERRQHVEAQRQPQPKREANADASAKTDEPKPERSSLANNAHFRILGFDKAENGTPHFYFFRKDANILIKLGAAAMTKPNLLTLAPLNWWEEYLGRPKGGVDIDAAQNFLIQMGTAAGVFRGERMLRGRGAWMDNGRVVFHVGNKLIVDGREVAFAQHASKYVYEAAEPLEITTAEPLPTEDAKKLSAICEQLNWDRKINAALLAGWCVIAPMCGALTWRPHIWIVGPAGTGKSWVMWKILRRMLGNTALAVQGNTSESGIRQTLAADALPVVFDEAESEDRSSQDRIQNILALGRAASSEDGGQILKGGGDGTAKRFTIRSMFACSSILPAIDKASDGGRFTILELVKPQNREEAKERFSLLEAFYNATITDEFVARLQARTIELLPTILRNAETFAEAVREEIKNQRAGDQLGILLAAAYSLYSEELITYADALAHVKKEKWEAEKGLEETRDEIRILSKITEQTERLGTVSRTIGELIVNAAGKQYDNELSSESANAVLKRCGLKVDKGRVFVSDSADWIKQRLKDSPWATTGHRHLLKRLEGAEEVKNTRFAGLSGRAISLPLTPYFIDKEEE
jgi:putative DNA primase/helicase